MITGALDVAAASGWTRHTGAAARVSACGIARERQGGRACGIDRDAFADVISGSRAMDNALLSRRAIYLSIFAARISRRVAFERERRGRRGTDGEAVADV